MEVKNIDYYIGFADEAKKKFFDYKKFKTMVQADSEGRQLSQFFNLQLLKSKNFE